MIQIEERYVQMISWMWIGLFVIAVVGVFMLAIGIIDGNRYVVRREHFVLPHLKKECRFVFISDLHGKIYGRNNEGLIEDVRRENPDFVVIAGDLITAKEGAGIEAGVHLVKELSKDFKVYYSMGNHETKLKQKREQFGTRFDELLQYIEHPNVTVLANDSCDIPEWNICMTGLELSRKYFARFKKNELLMEELRECIGVAEREKCNILLAHNPIYFEEYTQWGADLVLSGHVHGGIMRLPFLGGMISPSLELFPKYDGGVFEKNASIMLLGRGMGAHTIPLRFFNPAELYVVTLEAKKEV